MNDAFRELCFLTHPLITIAELEGAAPVYIGFVNVSFI